MEDIDAMYERYQKEAENIMVREKTATMTISNKGDPLDPKVLAKVDEGEALAFWEKSKCLTP